MFEFENYTFNPETYEAQFSYRGPRRKKYCEIVRFAKPEVRPENLDPGLLDRALFLSFVIIGTSYYKARPTPSVRFAKSLEKTLDINQADFFDHVYQEGLSQYAYENVLSRKDLAHFPALKPKSAEPLPSLVYSGRGTLVLQSGGKDSLLTATKLNQASRPWTALYVSSNKGYPKILDHVGAENIQVITRILDLTALKTSQKNGHVPVTYINMSLALVQAILNGQNEVLTSIGHEGAEPHSFIGDLEINHQWSKTDVAEKLFQNYVKNYISKGLKIYSPLRNMSELKIAEEFVKNCWEKFKPGFSSCNQANYTQKIDNAVLHWCGNCAKCANSYLLFAPFLDPADQNALFPDGKSLFENPNLENIFKGLLGIDGELKPFECVGEVAELRYAYHHKRPGYPDLPFAVPDAPEFRPDAGDFTLA